jgi:hypothetical protein
MDAYCLGSYIKLQATLKSSGVLTDSTTVRLLYKNPTGTVTVKTTTDLVNVSTGVYQYYLAGNSVGTWRYGFDSTGAIIAAYESAFRVYAREVTT